MNEILDYATLRVIWWLLVGVLLIGFAIMDGFDLGLGATFRLIGRNDLERRALLEAIEPVWEGNQVWLVLGGGAVFAAWPLVYATSFAGLYLAMFLVLVALILRPVGFAYRDKLRDPRWRNTWDFALTLAGAVPSLLFGVAFANLFLGLPFHFDELYRVDNGGGLFSLLHPFALLGGVISLAMLVMHGNAYAAMKVGEPMASRARVVGSIAALVYLAAFLAGGLWLQSSIDGFRIVGSVDHAGPSDPTTKTVIMVAGAWLTNYHLWPWMRLAPVVAMAAALTTLVILRLPRGRWTKTAFAASCLVQGGTILTAGFSLFPFMLPSSTHPNQSLTVWDASSSAKTLWLMLAAVTVLLPVVIAYTAWVFRVLKGRITLESMHDHEGPY